MARSVNSDLWELAVFSRFFVAAAGMFRPRYLPVEVNLDLTEFFIKEKEEEWISINFGEEAASDVGRPIRLRVKASYGEVLAEVRRAQQSVQPSAAEQFLDLGEIGVNLNHVAFIEQDEKGARLQYASGRVLRIGLTPDQIRSSAPRCFLSII
jgi:hypothetical protein